MSLVTPQYCELAPRVQRACTPDTYTPKLGSVCHNEGEGHFGDAIPPVGMYTTHGRVLILAVADCAVDFYVGNDGTPVELAQNLREMRFENMGITQSVSIVTRCQAHTAMGT